MAEYPCVLLEGDDWRIVRALFVNKQTGEEKPEDVVEVLEGKDAMGQRRWKTLSRSRDGAMGDWIRVAEGLKEALVAMKEL